MPRPARVSPDRVLAAAAAEFAERGFGGARVDRIARRARVNKAMLYYHFRSKRELYRTLLRWHFNMAAERFQAIAAGDGTPPEKLDRVAAGLAALVREHESFPAIMLREAAEGGAHLGRDTLLPLGRVSAQVEATDVQVAPQVGGRLMELRVAEGDRVQANDVIAHLDVADTQLALARARADRDQADAQLRLLLAGARPEDVRQAEAQVANAQSAVGAAEAELASAQADVDRFEALLASNSGSRKQRDDAVTRRDVARQRLQGAQDQVRAARENLARLRAGARPEEIQAARARVAAADAQTATYQKAIGDATVLAPVGGIVTEKLVDVGELVQAHAPIVVLTALDRAWAHASVDEPLVPRP